MYRAVTMTFPIRDVNNTSTTTTSTASTPVEIDDEAQLQLDGTSVDVSSSRKDDGMSRGDISGDNM